MGQEKSAIVVTEAACNTKRVGGCWRNYLFHSLLCLSGPSPPFLGTGCQPGCLQSWQESSCGSESIPMPTDGVRAVRIFTLPGAKLPTMYAAATPALCMSSLMLVKIEYSAQSWREAAALGVSKAFLW